MIVGASVTTMPFVEVMRPMCEPADMPDDAKIVGSDRAEEEEDDEDAADVIGVMLNELMLNNARPCRPSFMFACCAIAAIRSIRSASRLVLLIASMSRGDFGRSASPEDVAAIDDDGRSESGLDRLDDRGRVELGAARRPMLMMLSCGGA